jgi:class 3 adenylate cyclase
LARRESIQPIARTELCLEVRAAVHAGEIELEGGNVRGAAMHIAARRLGAGKIAGEWQFSSAKTCHSPALL